MDEIVVSEENWAKIEELYGGLFFDVAGKISGDRATHGDINDGIQDIKQAAIQAVIGFTKQNGGSNGHPDDFIGTRGFDKYFKTCLWNAKNTIGAKIKQKYVLNNGMVSISQFGDDALDLGASGLIHDDEVLEDKVFIPSSMTEQEREAISLIINDSLALMGNGKINVARIATKLSLPHYKAFRLITSIREKFRTAIV